MRYGGALIFVSPNLYPAATAVESCMPVHLSQAQSVMRDAELLFPAQQVQQAIARVADEISAQLADSNPLVLCVMNGGLVFSGQLLPLLKFPLQLGYLHASRYGKALSGAQLEWKHVPSLDLKGRAVLLLDDILDEGYTLQALINWCREQGATQVQVAVLLDKQHQRKADPNFVADYCGLECPDRYVFGCGMDYKGYWRNTNSIYVVKDEA